MVRVAAVQVRVDDREPVAARVDRVSAMVADLAGSADLVVLPELWPVGAFNIHLMMGAAEPLDGPFAARMAEVARAGGFWLHAGSYPELHDAGVSNTSLMFDPAAELRASYRKIHLFGFDEGEAVSLVSGERAVVTDTPLGVAGLSTCYDLRFPELYRLQSAVGAQAFLLPSGWPAPRIGHWSVLCRARAIENQAALVGCNAVGSHAGITVGGCSVIVAADGAVLAEAGPDDEEIITADVEPADIVGWRTDFPALANRRLG